MSQPAAPRTRSFVILLPISAGLGAGIMLAARWLTGSDPAEKLATTLRVGNGLILGALLGLIMGAWLSGGGRERIARFAGVMAGIAAGIALWFYGRDYVWLLKAFLIGIFGEEGALYTGFVAVLFLFLIVRAVAQFATDLLGALLGRAGRTPQSVSATPTAVEKQSAG